MNMLFRTVQETDLEAIFTLALKSGVGITTLPKDKAVIDARLKKSLLSFSRDIVQPKDEYYLFVLEDLNTQTIVGTAAIESLTGVHTPFYTYQHIQETHHHPERSISTTHNYLKLSYENELKSEVCTLYLDKDYRHSGNGLLLSLARFLFIYHFKERFAPTVIAELRGVTDDAGQSPFWNAVGHHFFQMPFHEADQLTITSDKRFIADLMPQHPIYINLLPHSAQQVIGVAHPGSSAAMKILVNEGFTHNHTVDIFDAGPTLEAQRDNIRTVKKAQKLTLKINDQHKKPTRRFLISNTDLAYRATIGLIHADLNEKICFASEALANTLQLSEGDLISISEIEAST